MLLALLILVLLILLVWLASASISDSTGTNLVKNFHAENTTNSALTHIPNRSAVISGGSRAVVVLDEFLRRWYTFLERLTYLSYTAYHWLYDVAPILIRYKARQIGLKAVDDLPYLSWQDKQELKRWLRDVL